MSRPAIETIGVAKRFPRQQGWRSLLRGGEEKVALAGIDLSIAAGEIFGLLGPNGAGKTTMVKILSTLLLPSEGQALVAGLDTVARSADVRARLGVVYGDERSFFWRLSAVDNLLFYAALYGIPRAEARRRVTALLDFVGLSKDGHRRMQHYSSGMRQRTSIARGLLNDPEILILDEPTRTLDPIASRDLRELIQNQVADGSRTVLITTNVMAEAEQLCHRVAFLNHGRIQLEGSIEHLQQLLRVEERHVLVVSNVSAYCLEGVGAERGVRSLEVRPEDDGRLSLVLGIERSSSAIPLVIRQIVEAGGDVWSCRSEELSLEDMFSIAVNGGDRTRREQVAV